MTDSIKWDI